MAAPEVLALGVQVRVLVPQQIHAFVAPAVERPLGTGKAASSNLAEGSMWL